jgi:hypothetical protein
MLRRRSLDERGAALIFVAVAMPAFIAFGIFVIDVGNWWVHKRHLQIEADAAALAGARSFRFPTCVDNDIVNEAVDYSGGVLADPDGNYATADPNPLSYNHQLAANARTTGPTQGIHTQVNTPDPWDGAHPTDRKNDNKWVDDDPDDPDDGDLHDMAAADRKPCTSMMIDVKMTETDLPGRFSPLRFLDAPGISDFLGFIGADDFVNFIDARARVELKAQKAGTDMLPLAVEDLNPKRVHVYLYDEDTQQLLGEAELNNRDPEDGLLIYDNDVTGSGTPITVDLHRQTINGQDATKQHIGVVVALSSIDSVTCGTAGVICYGTPASGVSRIRGVRAYEGQAAASCTDGIDNDGDGTSDNNDQDCRSVRLGAVRILKDTAICANNPYGLLHDNGYFSTTCTGANLSVELPGLPGANEAADNIFVNATIGGTSVALHYVSATGRWETTGTTRIPITLGGGSQQIDIDWSQRRNNSTLDMGGATPAICKSSQSQNPCKGTFTNVMKTFSGTRALSGPIKDLRIDIGGSQNVNNVTRCSAAETCSANVVVHLGLSGRLEITPPTSPPVALRIAASGPEILQTQQLNCQPNNTNTIDELAYGCDPLYQIKDDTDPCPNKATLFGSPNPPAYECVGVKPGAMNGPVGSGLNERFLCVPPNPDSNCTQFGKPQACTSPNRYPNFPDGDPRIIGLFLVPYGSLDSIGSGGGDTLPIANFAYFYVTHWHSKGGGFDNPCEDPGQDPPDVAADATSADDQGVVSGYFIKYVAPNIGGSGDAPCDPDTIGGCVAVMTK